MCGLAGFVVPGGLAVDAAEPIGARMADAILHRGPDSAGVWSDRAAGVVLAHRRLSILDLSPAGSQPMTSRGGRYVIAFNGEIYNHLDLRAMLAAESADVAAWRGHSDTETLLAGFEHWGIAQTLRQAVGMFALAVWDRDTRTLTLARDRIGEKPLYYGWQGSRRDAVFLFGSELKALRAHPAFAGRLDRGAISLQMRHSYVPAPYSIYKGIHKLEPGCTLALPTAEAARLSSATLTPEPYWTLAEAVRAGKEAPFHGGANEATNALDRLISDAVGKQMLADVPLGAFLSGGIDSSTIVASMQAQSRRPVKTFTIGFSEADYNEANFAADVARHLGTEHTELYVSPQQAMEVIPLLPTLYDEPFSDASQIPTHLVSRLARRQVAVALSGDAGDELFCGYSRYFGTQRWWRLIEAVPSSLRRMLAAAIGSISPATWDRLGHGADALIPGPARFAALGSRVQKLTGVLGVNEASELYRFFVSHWDESSRIVIDGAEPATQITRPAVALDSLAEQMMAMDSMSYLPDGILVKVDRAAMGVSLETRVPFLDHRVVEFAWRLPLDMKIRDGQGKWLLRQVLDKYVPKTLIERPKRGFGVPIGAWLRGPLRDWAESLLGESRLRRDGVFDSSPVRAKWREHLEQKRNWQYHLWDVLMFQAWLEAEQRGSSPACLTHGQ